MINGVVRCAGFNGIYCNYFTWSIAMLSSAIICHSKITLYADCQETCIVLSRNTYHNTYFARLSNSWYVICNYDFKIKSLSINL